MRWRNEGEGRTGSAEKEEISARCGVRAARVAHAASAKSERNRGSRKGITCNAEKEIVEKGREQ